MWRSGHGDAAGHTVSLLTDRHTHSAVCWLLRCLKTRGKERQTVHLESRTPRCQLCECDRIRSPELHVHLRRRGLLQHTHGHVHVLFKVAADGERDVAEAREYGRLDVAVELRALQVLEQQPWSGLGSASGSGSGFGFGFGFGSGFGFGFGFGLPRISSHHGSSLPSSARQMSPTTPTATWQTWCSS